VRIQILTALIAYLLLATYRKKHGITTSLWHLLAELRTTLFQRPALEVEQYRRRRERQLEMTSRQAALFACIFRTAVREGGSPASFDHRCSTSLGPRRSLSPQGDGDDGFDCPPASLPYFI